VRASAAVGMSCSIRNELAGIDLGDRRSEERIYEVAERLDASPSVNVREACGNQSDTAAAYRLFHSPKVTMEKILAPHRAATLKRAAASQDSLVLIQDTSECDYTPFKSMGGLGPLANKGCRGFFLHHHLLLEEHSGVPLGECGAEILTRPKRRPGVSRQQKAKATRPLPIEEKETRRWMHGVEQAHSVAESVPGRQVTMVGDCGCDIYEVYASQHAHAESPGAGADFVVRLQTDRVIEATAGDAKVSSLVENAPVLGHYEVELKAKVKTRKDAKGSTQKYYRQKRTARLEVRAIQIELHPPERHANRKNLPNVTLGLVVVIEKEPPEGQEPVEWWLWTSLPVGTLEEALRVVRIYSLRWRIEEFHRVLKTGCKVEELHFAHASRVHALLALYMIVAWRILFLRDSSRAHPQAPASEYFTPLELKSACLLQKRALEPEPTLEEAVKLVARIAGYRGLPSDPPPGTQCLWKGLTKLQHCVEMAELLNTS
jgi:hypothetical protein